MAEELGSAHFVDFPKGESKKCNDCCACREFCHFYKAMQEAQEVEEGRND